MKLNPVQHDLIIELQAENDRIKAENARLEELNVLQLAGIMTASIQNTDATVKDRIGKDNPYWTQAYEDVCRAVDREMALRKENARLAAQIEVMNVALGNATRKERWVMTTEGGTFPNPNNTDCLRDLLAPTIHAIELACDQLKRGEWNSHNSGTWTILDDALARLRAACGEKERP